MKGSCTKRDSVKQNFSNVEKKSNKIYELKSNIVSCSQLRNARYSANGWKLPVTYLENKMLLIQETMVYKKKMMKRFTYKV
jgi:hypothetical protein